MNDNKNVHDKIMKWNWKVHSVFSVKRETYMVMANERLAWELDEFYKYKYIISKVIKLITVIL